MSEAQGTPPDGELIDGVLDGDSAAFGHLVARHLDPVFAALRWRGLNEADASEVCRETFLRSYHELGTLQKPGDFGPLVQDMAAEEAIDFSRRRRPTTSFSRNLVDPFVDPHQHADAVLKSAAWIPDLERDVFFQLRRRGLRCDQLTVTSGIPVDEVQRRLRSAHLAMRAVLGPEGKYSGCPDHREGVLMIAAGESEASEARAVAGHLQQCSSCAAETERYREVFALVDELSGGQALHLNALASEIAAAAAGQPLPTREKQWPARLLWIAVAGTGAALALAVWGVIASV